MAERLSVFRTLQRLGACSKAEQFKGFRSAEKALDAASDWDLCWLRQELTGQPCRCRGVDSGDVAKRHRIAIRRTKWWRTNVGTTVPR